MLFFSQPYSRSAIGVLAGTLAFANMTDAPVAATPPQDSSAPAPAASAQRVDREQAFPPEDCYANAICQLKNKIRWRTPAWTPEFCRRVAQTVIASARQYDVAPNLILAVMINESDMNENAVLESKRDGEVYAKDSGLMGIRCLLDAKGRCTNGNVRGMPWKQLMDPLTNIQLGARELSKWRSSGVARATVRVRDGSGQLAVKEKFVTCQHKTHAYWAHYNHGPLYIDTGPARHYPHRIAVLYYALSRALHVDAPDLRDGQRVTINDPGKRARTADRPIEARYRKLTDQIREATTGVCSSVALHGNASPPLN